MRPIRTRSIELALLLAMLLPLQAFAAVLRCDPLPSHSAGAHSGCVHESGAPQQHHGCGGCCTIAIAVAPELWRAPRTTASHAFLLPESPAAKFLLDRLDRPPRTAIARG